MVGRHTVYTIMSLQSWLSGGDEPEIGIGHRQGIVFTTPGVIRANCKLVLYLGGNRGMIQQGART